MTLAAILYRHLGKSVPAVPEVSRLSGTTENIAPQPVPVVPAVPEEKQGSNSASHHDTATSGEAFAIAQKPPIPAAAPLVTPDDLYRVQRPLLAHLTHCRACIVDLHRYCQAIEREANGYEAFLAEFPDMEQRHQDFVGEVIRARHAVFVRSVH